MPNTRSTTDRMVADLLSLVGLALLIFTVLASQQHGDVAMLGIGLCVVGGFWRQR